MINESEFTVIVSSDIIEGDEVLYRENFFVAHLLVLSENYSEHTHRHNFRLRVRAVDGEMPSRRTGDIFTLRGSQLYPRVSHRKPWASEDARNTLRAEKHQRGYQNKAAFRRNKEE